MNLDLFFDPKVDLPRFRAMLDTLGHQARRRALQSLSPKQLSALFEAAKDGEALELDFLVPAGTDAMTEVIHHGRNSLPLFHHFQKRFVRPDGEGSSEEVWGLNHSSTSPFTGPGYFVARKSDNGELVVDYTALPPRKPRNWPEIIPNSDRLGRFVWVGMKDYLRKVSEHASIGRAFKNGQPMNAWFVLCREDPMPG